MVRIVSENEFREVFCAKLDEVKNKFDYVTGPGRSGAVAAVYASHYLGLPFLPYKSKIENKKPLIVDTAMMTGKTLRKASKFYNNAPYVYAYLEGPRVKFWYEKLSAVRERGHEYPNSTKSKNLKTQ
jgi:adenine/guanine phosphoribosyltransferase-like PRPP-binding protein